MSILIKGMEMPKTCGQCRFGVFGWCAATSPIFETLTTKRNKKCPLIEVPPHGRLIDADALEKSIVIQIELCKQLLKLLKCPDNIHDIANQCGVLEEILEEIKNTSTVIPADEENETDFS